MKPEAVISRRRLSALESVIERGRQTFVAVGRALLEIRESRLYRENYGTFEEYCRERWGWSRVTAHRHIQAAQAVELLPIGNRPQTESQARELALLRSEPEKVQKVWRESVETFGPEPTAQQIRSVRLAGSGMGEEALLQMIMDRMEDGCYTPDSVLHCGECGAPLFALSVEEVKARMEGLVTEGRAEKRPQGKATDSPGDPIYIYVPAGTGSYNGSGPRGDENQP